MKCRFGSAMESRKTAESWLKPRNATVRKLARDILAAFNVLTAREKFEIVAQLENAHAILLYGLDHKGSMVCDCPTARLIQRFYHGACE